MHHAQEVFDHIYDSGVIIHFLPPNSPDLNPMKEAFAEVKHYLRQIDLVLQSVQDPSPCTYIGSYGFSPSNTFIAGRSCSSRDRIKE